MKQNDTPATEGQPLLKYSKASAFYLDTKRDFFNGNAQLLKKSLDQNRIYAAQPKRVGCKICQKPLRSGVDFTSHGVGYIFCGHCSHLNGEFDDSEEFVKNIYLSDGGSEYSVNYIDEKYSQRTKDIYIPKVEFLTGSIPATDLSVLDVGCGSGYFVYASLLAGLSASGIDVNKKMVDFGNAQINNHIQKQPLSYVNEDGFFRAISETKADVVSAIGVIEHLRKPHDFFEAFKKSKARFLYYSVPMFSLSVALENVFGDVFPRQLSGGHTHLFTESSIKEMNSLISVQSIAEWRFGTDAMDLFRSLMTKLQANQASQELISKVSSGLGGQIDGLQAVLDKSHFCSEIHLIAEKRS